METLLDKIGTKLLQNKKEETVHTLDRVAIVQDALERYELKRKEVNEPWDYHKLVGFVLTALKEKGLNERSDMVGCLISKALLIPNKESYKSLSEQTINQIKSDGVFERRGWVSPELVTKELKERTWGERADKLSNLIPEVQEVEERKEEERLSFADTVGDKVKKWEDLKNQVVSKTSWVKEGLRNMFQMRGWNLPDKEEEILTSKNVYHKVVGFVHEFLSNYEMPGIVDIKVDRLRNAAYEDNSVDRKLSSADIILGLLFQTMSGVKINAEMIVPVRKGEFVEPSTFFIEGNSRIIAQSTFDDIAKKGRIKRQPFKNPEDIVSPDILKKYQQLELPFMSTGLYSASKEIMDKTAGRLMTRKSSYTPIDKDELIKELEDLSLEVELKGHDYQINAITNLAQKLKNNPIRTETGLWNSDEIEARLEDISWREVGASTALQDVAGSLKKWSSFQKKYKRVSEKNVLSAIQEAIISYGKVRQEVKADWNYEEMRKFVGKKLQETNLEYDVRKIGNYINKVLWGQREEDCCKEVDTDTTKNANAFVAHKKIAVIQKCKEKDKESAEDVWCVYSEKGKLMGRYKTEAEANKRLQQIHYFKQQGEKKDVDTKREPSEWEEQERNIKHIITDMVEKGHNKWEILNVIEDIYPDIAVPDIAVFVEQIMPKKESVKAVKTEFKKFYDKYPFEITNKEEMQDFVLALQDEFDLDYIGAMEMIQDAYNARIVDKKFYDSAKSSVGLTETGQIRSMKEEEAELDWSTINRVIDFGISSLAGYGDKVDKVMDYLMSSGDYDLSDEEWIEVENQISEFVDALEEGGSKESKELKAGDPTEGKEFEEEIRKGSGIVDDDVIKKILFSFYKVDNEESLRETIKNDYITDYYHEQFSRVSHEQFAQEETEIIIEQHMPDNFPDIKLTAAQEEKMKDIILNLVRTRKKKSELGGSCKESGYISEDRTEGRPPTKDNLAGGSSEEVMDAIVGDKKDEVVGKRLTEDDLETLHNFRSVVKDRIHITPTQNKYKTRFGYDVEYYDENGSFEYGYGVLGSNIEDAYTRLLTSLKEHNILIAHICSRKKEAIVFSRESLVNTINEIIQSGSTKELLSWIGLAGGKKKLEQILDSFSEVYEVDIPDDFFELLDQASKEWRAAPESSYVGPKPWGGRRSNSVEELKLYVKAQGYKQAVISQEFKGKAGEVLNGLLEELGGMPDMHPDDVVDFVAGALGDLTDEEKKYIKQKYIYTTGWEKDGKKTEGRKYIAQDTDWKSDIKKLINSASKESIYNWVTMQDLGEEFSEQLSYYSPDDPSSSVRQIIFATPLSELHERFLGSWDDWTEDGYQFLLTHKG